ncbi:hypothetical protein QTN25_010297 [Entamoeba marina]
MRTTQETPQVDDDDLSNDDQLTLSQLKQFERILSQQFHSITTHTSTFPTSPLSQLTSSLTRAISSLQTLAAQSRTNLSQADSLTRLHLEIKERDAADRAARDASTETRIKTAEDRAQKIADELFDKDREIAKKETTITLLKAEIEAASSRDAERRDDVITALKTTTAEKDNEINELKTKIDKITNELNQTNLKNNQKRFSRRKDQDVVRALQTEMIDKYKEVAKLTQDLVEAHNKINQIIAEKEKHQHAKILAENAAAEATSLVAASKRSEQAAEIRAKEARDEADSIKIENDELKLKIKKLQDELTGMKNSNVPNPTPKGLSLSTSTNSTGHDRKIVKPTTKNQNARSAIPQTRTQPLAQSAISKPNPNRMSLKMKAMTPVPALYDFKVESKFEPNVNDLPYEFEPIVLEVVDGRNRELKKYWNLVVKGKVDITHIDVVCKGFGFNLIRPKLKVLYNSMDVRKDGRISFEKFHDVVMEYIHTHPPNKKKMEFVCPISK